MCWTERHTAEKMASQPYFDPLSVSCEWESFLWLFHLFHPEAIFPLCNLFLLLFLSSCLCFIFQQGILFVSQFLPSVLCSSCTVFHVSVVDFFSLCILVSAFYAEHWNKKISLDGYIWTKSKFLGLSIGVHMIGQAVISVIDHEEEYIFTFPNGYGRYLNGCGFLKTRDTATETWGTSGD